MKTKIKYLISGLLIFFAVSAYLISEQEIEPPPAILEIDGKEQISGIGSYCWRGILKGYCPDMIGLPTEQEPLVVLSPFTSHLTLPVQEKLYEVRLYAVPVKEEDELNFSGRGWRWWKVNEENIQALILPLENKQDIELSLDPGLYVLHVGAWWNGTGSASYGFLVEVREKETGAVSTTPRFPVNQTLPSDATTTPTITTIQPDIGTIGTRVIITGAGFTARDNNIAFRLAPGDNHVGGYRVGYINDLLSSDGRTIEFEIPDALGACAFPLPETTPVTVCPSIGILFNPGTQTYPVFVVNKNGTSNSVNFTMSG